MREETERPPTTSAPPSLRGFMTIKSAYFNFPAFYSGSFVAGKSLAEKFSFYLNLGG